MPAKLTTICYVHSCTERITQEYIVKDITSIVKLKNDEPSNIIYLNIKAFIPLNDPSNNFIKAFQTGDVIYLKKNLLPVIAITCATSIKVLEFDFEDMSALGINMTIVGITTQIVQNTSNDLTLKFYIEEKVSNRKPSNFWVETKHNTNNNYHQIPGYQQGCKPCGAISKALKKNHTTLSNMNPTSTSQTQSLLSALKTNPIPNMSDQQSSTQTHENETSQDNQEN
ncbi:hypothetical protein F8M41_005050 [Gigaspora margarita]|uniref:Uncharacterized protein n=1 Tax=Gigaspora margarita TaxID=4874 RepID=A0A8H4A759_GIGMA|nr:hypothetical protein F8M41_005050 [Gigaspora margarita]